jgi:hypothetical protein
MKGVIRAATKVAVALAIVLATVGFRAEAAHAAPHRFYVSYGNSVTRGTIEWTNDRHPALFVDGSVHAASGCRRAKIWIYRNGLPAIVEVLAVACVGDGATKPIGVVLINEDVHTVVIALQYQSGSTWINAGSDACRPSGCWSQ